MVYLFSHTKFRSLVIAVELQRPRNYSAGGKDENSSDFNSPRAIIGAKKKSSSLSLYGDLSRFFLALSGSSPPTVNACLCTNSWKSCIAAVKPFMEFNQKFCGGWNGCLCSCAECGKICVIACKKGTTQLRRIVCVSSLLHLSRKILQKASNSKHVWPN